MQDVLSGKKNALLVQNVPAKNVPKWPELSVKECYPKAIKILPKLESYLPSPWGKDQRLPEREYFWRTMYALYPKETDAYIRDVEASRRKESDNL